MEETVEHPINITGHDIRLKSLSLSNFRGFINLADLHFDDQLTVLVARNGGGKTTILDAIAAALKIYTYQLSKSLLSSHNYFDLNNRAEAGWINLKTGIKYDYEYTDEHFEEPSMEKDPIPVSVSDSIEKDFGLRIDLNRVGIQAKIDGYNANEKSEFGVASIGEVKIKYKHLPVILYFGNEKTNGHIPETVTDLSNSNVIQVFDNCLNPKRFDFDAFLKWFGKIYKLANFSEGNNDLEKKMLLIIKEVVENTLNRFNDDDTYKNLRMRYANEGDFMVIDKKDPEGKYDFISYEQLSDGEKIILALVADITRRLIIANPDLIDNKEKGKKDVLQGRGIILIDEIDMHLHPTWQEKIAPLLIDLFPKIQFVITTHSPQVLVNIRSQHVLNIDKNVIYGVSETYGHDIGSITEEVMGASSSPFDDEFKELFRHVSDQNKEKSLKIFNKLKKKIEGQTPDLVKAELSLSRRGWL